MFAFHHAIRLAAAAAFLLFPATARALIVADSASDVCAATADPCIVSQEVDVIDGSTLDFGTRTVRVQGGGFFDFDIGSGTIACGTFHAAVSGTAVKAKGTIAGVGTAGGVVTIEARRRCSINSAVLCLVDSDCMEASAGLCTSGSGTIDLDGKILGNADVAANIILHAAGDIDVFEQITVSSTSPANDAGTISILSELGSIQIDGKLDLTSGAAGSGGDLVLSAGVDVDVDQTIEANGGDLDGGTVAIQAGRDVSITQDIFANSISGAGYGGEISVQADGDLSIVGGGAANRLSLSTEGHQSFDNSAGDGGLQSYDADTITVSQYVRFEASGSPPDGFGGLITFTVESEFTLAGQILNKAKGALGGGGNVEITSDGGMTINATALIDVTGQASGGGDIVVNGGEALLLAGNAVASGTNGGAAGRVLVSAGADATISGTLQTVGANSSFSHGELAVEACRVIVSGALVNNGQLGENRLIGRERITIPAGGSVRAFGAGGSNTLRYRDAAKPPIVQGSVSPSPILIVDTGLAGCPVCGNGEIDQGESCDDGGLTGGDGCSATCQDEGCIAQTPGYPSTPLCSDGNQCTDDACNPVNHTCTHVPNTCSDGIACTTDACSVNVCTHTPVHAQCDDANPCTADTCSTSVGCVHPAQSASCSDGIFCNGDDTCAAGACTQHAGDPCTGGAECANVCEEGADACRTPAGVACTDDGNACTNDACDGAGACAHPNNSGACSDGVFCNGADTCAGGSCSQHAGDPCLAGGECSNACNEGADNCLDPAGAGCGDDGNVCTDDACNGAGTCAHAANSEPCDDANFCTVDDVCASGVCDATPAPLLRVASLKAQLRPADDEDRMSLKGSLPLQAMSVSPVNSGMRVVAVSELDGSVLYDGAVPAGGFTAAGNGSVFRFKASSPSAAGGILKASLKVIASSGLVKARFKMAGLELTDLVATGRVTVAMVFGEEPGSSPCTGSAGLDCKGTDVKIVCKSP